MRPQAQPPVICCAIRTSLGRWPHAGLRNHMSSAPPAEEIWRNARWVAQALDPIADLIRFVELSPEAYRAESFLDDRILQRGSKSHLVKWAEVQATCPADVRTDARWIFHIGHVGSTLVSRLLGELDGVLAVREPRSLRDLTF